jgi:hypothetical protein
VVESTGHLVIYMPKGMPTACGQATGTGQQLGLRRCSVYDQQSLFSSGGFAHAFWCRLANPFPFLPLEMTRIASQRNISPPIYPYRADWAHLRVNKVARRWPDGSKACVLRTSLVLLASALCRMHIASVLSS